MSRYKLTARDDRPDIDHAVLGWDRPLETFFAQVFTKASPEEDAIVWVGTDYREIRSPEAAIAAVEQYAIVPDDMRSRLLNDFADKPARHPDPGLAHIRVRVRSAEDVDPGLVGREGHLVRPHLSGYIVKLDPISGEQAPRSEFFSPKSLDRLR
jgi:hypothetical protein